MRMRRGGDARRRAHAVLAPRVQCAVHMCGGRGGAVLNGIVELEIATAVTSELAGHA